MYKWNHDMLIGTHIYYFKAYIRLRITVLADRHGTTNLMVPFLNWGYLSWKNIYIVHL